MSYNDGVLPTHSADEILWDLPPAPVIVTRPLKIVRFGEASSRISIALAVGLWVCIMLELMPQRSGGYWTRERTIALDLITFHCVISIVSFAAAWKRPIAWVCLAVAAISACALVYFPDYLDRLYHVIQ